MVLDIRAQSKMKCFSKQRILVPICCFILATFYLSSPLEGQQILSVKEAQQQQADALFNAAVTTFVNAKSNEAIRLLQVAYGLQPSAMIAQTIGSLFPATELSAKRYWYEKAISLDPDNEDALFPLSILNCQEDRYEEAVALLSAYRQRHPESEEASYYLALIYSDQGEYGKAIPLLNELIKSAKKQSIEEAAQKQLLAIQMTNGATEDVVNHLVAQADLTSKDPNKLFESASQLGSLGAYRQALDLLSKSPLIKENYPNLIALKAVMHMTLGESEAGMKECKRVLSLPQLTPEERFSLLQTVLQLDPNKEKNSLLYIALLEQFVQENPQEEGLQNAYLAYLYKYLDGSDKKIEEQLIRMSHLFPKREDIAMSLLATAISQMKYEQADSIAQSWIKKAPKSYKPYMYAALLQMLQGHSQEAITIVQQRLVALPTSLDVASIDASEKEEIASLYLFLGDAYYAEKAVDKAFEMYEKALSYDDKLPSLLNNYAYGLAQEGKNLQKAEDLAARAVSLLPESVNCMDTYAYVLMLRKNYTLAEVYIRRALEVEPQKASLHDRFAEILQAQEKYHEALEQLERAEEIEPTVERSQMIQALKDKIRQMR